MSVKGLEVTAAFAGRVRGRSSLAATITQDAPAIGDWVFFLVFFFPLPWQYGRLLRVRVPECHLIVLWPVVSLSKFSPNSVLLAHSSRNGTVALAASDAASRSSAWPDSGLNLLWFPPPAPNHLSAQPLVTLTSVSISTHGPGYVLGLTLSSKPLNSPSWCVIVEPTLGMIERPSSKVHGPCLGWYCTYCPPRPELLPPVRRL